MNAHTFESDFRDAVGEGFLATFFDGEEHAFGAIDVECPDVDVAFDRPEFGAAKDKPLIYVQVLGGNPVTRRATASGKTERRDIPCLVWVYTTDAAGNWTVNDRIQDCLAVIFNGAAPDLAAQGLRVNMVKSAFKVPHDRSGELQMSQRPVLLRVQLNYARKA